jgi:ADP-ribose pyrophosphatase
VAVLHLPQGKMLETVMAPKRQWRMDKLDVEILARTQSYRGFLRVDEYKLRHRLFAGGWSPVLSREVMERGNAVAATLYDPARDQVVLIEQFRIGAYTAGQSPWMVEGVAGMLAKDADPIAVLRHEIAEETGLEATAIERIGRAMASPGGTSECVEMYAAKVDATKAIGFHGLADEGEDIRVFAEDFATAFASFFDGSRLGSGFTIMCLQWLALNRERLRTQWRD